MKTRSVPTRTGGGGSAFSAHLALVVVVFLWGFSFTSTKIVLNTGFPPLTIAFVRFAIASAVMFAILRAKEKRVAVSKRDLIPLALSGLLGVTLYFYFENRGIRLTTASNASLIIAAIPVFAVAAETVFFRHRVPLYKIGGIGLSIAGIYLLVRAGSAPGGSLFAGFSLPGSGPGPGPGRPADGDFAGSLLMLGACFSWVAYIIVSKKFTAGLSRVAVTSYQFLFGTVFLAPLALLERGSWVPMGPGPWLNLLFLALFCSAAAYFLYLYGLFRLNPTTVSSYINLIPVVGALSGILVLGERLLPSQVLGGIGVIAGVVIVNLRGRRRASGQPST